MFHVYNKFDSMDCIHVYAASEQDAISIALQDGYLTDTLGVEDSDIVAYPFSRNDQTSIFVRRVNAYGVIEAGR
ncbi:MAG: hypothetical protein CBB72_006870 [Muricauda sp. TMED12]|nr:MAG: hypothetical protein CBB72_006870 [Muricauda sp. TMED12]